jgi:hypothetical protein
MNMKQEKAIQARTKLAAGLPSFGEILRGSVLYRHVRHRSGCSICANGKGHPVWILSVSYPGGRLKQLSLRPDQIPAVRQQLRNYRKLIATVHRICDLNCQLLRPE